MYSSRNLSGLVLFDGTRLRLANHNDALPAIMVNGKMLSYRDLDLGSGGHGRYRRLKNCSLLYRSIYRGIYIPPTISGGQSGHSVVVAVVGAVVVAVALLLLLCG